MNTYIPSPHEHFMTASQVASLLGVSERRVRKIAEEKKFDYKVGHIWLFSRQDALSLLEERKRSRDWRIKK
jgi:excisionase family DNA binding protein